MANNCKHCQALEAEVTRLRKKLSPLLDQNFANMFWSVEPVALYKAAKVVYRQHEPAYSISLKEVWDGTPVLARTPPSPLDLTKLGRAMDAKGWERTKVNGQLRMLMRLTEFKEVYGE